MAVLVTATLGSVAPAQAGLRIVGGSTTPIESTPWQVGLLWAGTANTYHAQFCGGIVRDATTIVTAAHCVGDVPAASLDVLAGTSTLGSAGGQWIRSQASRSIRTSTQAHCATMQRSCASPHRFHWVRVSSHCR